MFPVRFYKGETVKGEGRLLMGADGTTARVVAVASDPAHRFSKASVSHLDLVEGLGVRGDAHFGATVQHLSRVARDPTQPNLRQVHLIHAELFNDLKTKGFHVKHGELGENVTTAGVDLLSLPRGARLRLGQSAVVEITGLRNPCAQIDRFQSGLMHAVLDRDAAGNLLRKAGVMAVVVAGGAVRPDDAIQVELPAGPYRALEPV